MRPDRATLISKLVERGCSQLDAEAAADHVREFYQNVEGKKRWRVRRFVPLDAPGQAHVYEVGRGHNDVSV